MVELFLLRLLRAQGRESPEQRGAKASAKHSRTESLVSQTAAAGDASEMGSFQGLAFRAESQEGE